MIQLKNRSGKKELLDADDVPFVHIKKNMQELNSINSLLGGHAITLEGFKNFFPSSGIVVCEIGCGGGDNLHVIDSYCRKNKIPASFIGVDIKPACIDFAKEQYPDMECEWLCCDYIQTPFTKQPDVIFSSLFCHHFSDDEIVGMLVWMKEKSNKGFFINDLERNTIAYYSIKWLTALFSKSFMVKHDAPVSVTRGFRKEGWKRLLQKAGIPNADIKWKWAFRHLIIFKK